MSNLWQPTIVIGDAAINPDTWLFPRQFEPIKPGSTVRPTFTVNEVSKFFFARSSAWLRTNERKAYWDDIPLPEFLGREVGARREYTLYDIERIAHAFAQSGFINGERLRIALRLLQLEAQCWRYLMDGAI
jgi:hypothetical protein